MRTFVYFVYMYICIYVCTHKYIHTYIHTYRRAHRRGAAVNERFLIRRNACVCEGNAYTLIHTHKYIHTYIHTYRRAHRRGAAVNERFWIRRNACAVCEGKKESETEPDLAELTLDEIINGNGGLKVFGLNYCIR